MYMTCKQNVNIMYHKNENESIWVKVVIYAVMPQFQIYPNSRIFSPHHISIPNSEYRLECAVQTELRITDWSVQCEVYNDVFHLNCTVEEKITSYIVQYRL